MIKISNLTLGLIGLFLILAMLSSLPAAPAQKPVLQTEPTQTPIPATPVEFAPVNDIAALPFQDNQALYQNDDPTSIVVFYITVRQGNALDNSNYTWTEVNNFDKWLQGSLSANDKVGKAEVIVQVGDENGPLSGELGYDALVPNGTIQIRGASSSANPNPKSYKIELFDDAGTWRGQSTIPLNKHYYDPIRVKNKLAYDLLKQIPNMVSLRTQFVHLYVKDETIDPKSTRFRDYGLYTQIEQVNKAYLRNHQLDTEGHLYKATSFEFYRYPDQIRLETDPLFDEDGFSHRLEIKGSQDHSKIIRMLDDLNNYDVPIKQIFEKYFDAENYFTWLAFNILVGNIDTQNQNFYLYSPQNSEIWYFIPWDYDGNFARQRQDETGTIPYLPWEAGISNYWGSVLHNRVLRQEEYRKILDDKINEIYVLLSPEKIESMLNAYRDVTEPFLNRSPDANQLIVNPSQFNLIYSLIPSEVESNRVVYYESLSLPMPFFLGIPRLSNGMLQFNWDKSHNFVPQNITYRFLVSRDTSFGDIVYEAELLNITSIEVPVFEPGEYYWRVIATNEDEKSQYPFDAYFASRNGSTIRYGAMKYFSITPEGQLGEAQ